MCSLPFSAAVEVSVFVLRVLSELSLLLLGQESAGTDESHEANAKDRKKEQEERSQIINVFNSTLFPRYVWLWIGSIISNTSVKIRIICVSKMLIIYKTFCFLGFISELCYVSGAAHWQASALMNVEASNMMQSVETWDRHAFFTNSHPGTVTEMKRVLYLCFVPRSPSPSQFWSVPSSMYHFLSLFFKCFLLVCYLLHFFNSSSVSSSHIDFTSFCPFTLKFSPTSLPTCDFLFLPLLFQPSL